MYSLHYSTANMDIQGSAIMPLYFILSGFSLAAIYGHKATEVCGGCGKWSSFFRNRLARLLPVYYFCNLIGN